MLTEEPFTKPGTDYCIQEFFILRRHRNKHIGHGVLVRDEIKYFFHVFDV